MSRRPSASYTSEAILEGDTWVESTYLHITVERVDMESQTT